MSDLVERLEPCPFCAGIADDTHAGVAPELHEDSHTNIYVWCPNCAATENGKRQIAERQDTPNGQ